MRLAAPATALLCALASLAVVACESSQDKARKLKAQAGEIAQASGLKITKRSRDVEVIDATVMFDENGAAVAIEVRNKTAKTFVDVPILIDLKGAGGKSVYRNDLPGLDPALTSLPLLKPHETAEWVNDQIQPTGRPKSVKAVIGEAKGGSLKAPKVTAATPKLTVDPISGIEATGKAVNHSGAELRKLLLYAVARRGGKVVAAGRGGIDKLKAGKSFTYHIFFIGDPRGAEIVVTVLPTQQGQQGGSDSGLPAGVAGD